jgi:NAD(P)H-dependent FMN reductase
MVTISAIIGSTREGRFSETPARWILQHLQKRDGIEARLLDLRDFPMPFFDQPLPPAVPGRKAAAFVSYGSALGASRAVTGQETCRA